MSSKWRQLKPLEWAEYVNKEVKVTAHEKQQHEGWVFTVDPVSASIVLVNLPENGSAVVKVVMGHAVEELEVLQEGSLAMLERIKAVFSPQEAQIICMDELKRRKDNLRVWLEKNRIPVEEEGETLKVANVLTVNPPYGVEDCSSPNEIILARVQSLIERNPGALNPADV